MREFYHRFGGSMIIILQIRMKQVWKKHWILSDIQTWDLFKPSVATEMNFVYFAALKGIPGTVILYISGSPHLDRKRRGGLYDGHKEEGSPLHSCSHLTYTYLCVKFN